jgi:hypothetical protein
MKKFRNFLTEKYLDILAEESGESTGSYIPAPNAKVGSKYPDTPEGWSQWKEATKSSAANQRKEAEEQTEKAAGKAENLEKTKRVVGAVKSGADAALSAGAFAVPGAGSVINAGVKSAEAGIDLSQGNNLSAGMNMADAALPYAGKLAGAANAIAKTAPVAAKLASETERAVSGAKTAFTAAINPLSVALETTAKKTGVSGMVARGIERGTESAAEAIQKYAPKAAESLNLATKEGAEAVSKKAGEIGSESGVRIVSDVAGETVGKEAGRAAADVARQYGTGSVASSDNKKSRINIASRETTPRNNKPKA